MPGRGMQGNPVSLIKQAFVLFAWDLIAAIVAVALL